MRDAYRDHPQHKPLAIAPRGLFTPDAEYRRVMQQKASAEAWLTHIWRLQWQVYVIATFTQPVSHEYAREAGASFIHSLGPSAYGVVAWGEGALGGRSHVHLLLGGLWTGRLLPSARGLDLFTLNTRLLTRQWKHGMMTKVERFDPKRRSLYLVDHHEVEIVGHPRRHIHRKKKRRRSSSPENREVFR